PEGGFDHDMFELQKEFLIGYLLQFVTEIRTPLYHVRNNRGQRDDVPEGVYFEGQEPPPADAEIREVVRDDDLACERYVGRSRTDTEYHATARSLVARIALEAGLGTVETALGYEVMASNEMSPVQAAAAHVRTD